MHRFLVSPRQRLLAQCCLVWKLIAFALLLPAPVGAQTSHTTDRSASVLVQHRKVVLLRAAFLGVPPAERARRAEENIQRLLEQGGPGEVTARDEPQGKVVLVDGTLAFLLLPDDADTMRGESLEGITRNAELALTQAIFETREARDRSRLITACLYSGLATLLFALLVWAISRTRRALLARSAGMLASSSVQLQMGGLPLLHSTRLRDAAHWIIGAVLWLVLAVLAYEWLVYVLTRFAYTRAWGEQLGSFLQGVLGQLAGSALHALPGISIAALIFLLARGMTALARPIFERGERGQSKVTWLDRDLAVPSRRIFTTAVWLFAIVMAYPYLPGADSDAFKGISVLVGLMLTLGGSSLVGQGASGLLLMYSRTIRVGEYVRINDHEGTVTELGTFTTKIRTGLGEEISMPNSLIMGAVTKNYSRAVRGPGYILDTVMTIGYDTSWRQVEAMMVEAARRTEGVVNSPEPQVFKTALSDFYVEYRLVCQAIPEKPRPRAEILQLLHSHLLDVFNEHDVQIMSPHYLADPASNKVVPQEQWWAAPAQKPGSKNKP